MTRNQITFLKDIPSNFKVDKTSGWRHHYFDDLSIISLSSFIKLIGDDKIYLIIPFFGCPNSASTFNFSSQQLRELDVMMDNGDQLDQETLDLVEEDFHTLLGDEQYNQYIDEVTEINDQMLQLIQKAFSNFS